MQSQERDLKFWDQMAVIYDIFINKDKAVYDCLGTEIMNMVGFRTYSSWQSEEYIAFIADQGWAIMNDKVMKASFPVAFVTARKRT